jgi:hypothetical protein
MRRNQNFFSIQGIAFWSKSVPVAQGFRRRIRFLEITVARVSLAQFLDLVVAVGGRHTTLQTTPAKTAGQVVVPVLLLGARQRLGV